MAGISYQKAISSLAFCGAAILLSLTPAQADDDNDDATPSAEGHVAAQVLPLATLRDDGLLIISEENTYFQVMPDGMISF